MYYVSWHCADWKATCIRQYNIPACRKLRRHYASTVGRICKRPTAFVESSSDTESYMIYEFIVIIRGRNVSDVACLLYDVNQLFIKPRLVLC